MCCFLVTYHSKQPLLEGGTAVRLLRWFPVALAAFLLVGGGLALADTGKKPTAKEESSFGALRAVDPAEARKQAEAWLKSVGKTDAGSLAKLKTIWDGDRALLDKVAATLALGDPQAAKLLADARDADAAAPTADPATAAATSSANSGSTAARARPPEPRAARSHRPTAGSPRPARQAEAANRSRSHDHHPGSPRPQPAPHRSIRRRNRGPFPT
jgi:hypothetical protein